MNLVMNPLVFSSMIPTKNVFLFQYIWEVKVDGVTYLSTEINNPVEKSNIEIYMGKTWGAIIAPDAVIENFIYEDYDTPSIEYIGKYLNLGVLLLKMA